MIKEKLLPVIKATLACMAVIFIAESIIGKQVLQFGSISIPLLPMLFAVVIGTIVTLPIIRDKISVWGKTFTEKEESFAAKMVGFSLLVLGTQYAGMIVPKLDMIIEAGPALIFQELGNLLPIFIAIPLAVKFGMGREAIGAGSSISREPSIAVMESKYGAGTPEYLGVMGIYLCGSIIGTIWFTVLGSTSIFTGLHPYALAAGSGVGSGSMLSAASGALAASVDPTLVQGVLSISAASNLLSCVLGSISLSFFGLPIAEKVYKMCQKEQIKTPEQAKVVQ